MSPPNVLAGALLAAAALFFSAVPASDAPAAVPADFDAVPALQAETGDDAHVADDTFLLLREAARQDDAAKANAYASRLPDYDIPSYVDYYRLKPRLKDASQDEIRAFLKRYEGSAIADRLRNDWLLELGKKRDWASFDQQLPLYLIDDDTQVKCYALLSRVTRGQKVADESRALLINPGVYGEACNALIAALAQARQFDTDDLLTQLRLAGEFNATGPARRAAALLGASETRAVQAVDLPALGMARGIGKGRAEHEIYLVALGRMAVTSIKLASIALNKVSPNLSEQERAIGWANLALRASMQLSPDAYDFWKKSEGAPLSLDQLQWKTRIALRRGDWPTVRATIDAMPATLRADSAWTYWMGRALQVEGGVANNEAALALYRRIAEQSSFYGQLAIEETGRKISIPTAAPTITAAEIAPMAANAGFRRALKFFNLRLRFEGTREWNWELRKMSEREHLAAAEFARQNDIYDRMVNTSERTHTEVDYTQRFPSPHIDILTPTAQNLGLDKAWVYGLIRQESRFILDARSRVGASGLMQVMPSTGKYVAKKIGMTDFAHSMLGDLRMNITLGANYMNMILASMGGSETLATSAYNAGPGRTGTWRATLTAPMEGAIFAESIPYPETRAYVKNVMANATNYAALFENKPQSLKARLGRITPKGYEANDLPNNAAR